MMVPTMPNLPNNSGIGDNNWRDESADCFKIKFAIGDPAFAISTGKPEAAPFDLLGDQAFNAPVLARRQRAARRKQQHVACFKFFAPEASEHLDHLLEKYASDGELEFTLPDVLKVRSISNHGNVNEIIGKFGGADHLRTAVNQLQSRLYAAYNLESYAIASFVFKS